MSNLKALWSTTKSQVRSYRAPRFAHQELSSASTIQLQDVPLKEIDTGYAPGPFDFKQLTLGQQTDSGLTQRSQRDYRKGWRFGVINCAFWATVVFVINLIVTIWGSAHNRSSTPGILLDGDCTRVKQLNTGIHLLINGLSTILLSSSNYCMQCLSAPTRREVDTAHAKGTWLDIGIPSVRNLRHIEGRRILLWMLLGLSSLPLHLFYNSAVFSSISSNDYVAISVSQSFIDSEECVNCDKGVDYGVNDLNLMHIKARNGELERLEPENCITNYAETIQSYRRNVLLVASDDNFPSPDNNTWLEGSRVYWFRSFRADDAVGSRSLDSYWWMCSAIATDEKCNKAIEQVKAAPENWRVGNTCIECSQPQNYPVQYCLSEVIEPHCKLQFSLAIAILVTVLNFFKAALMFYVAYAILEDPLITMGDAVASFLEEEDSYSKGMCLLSFKDIKSKTGYRTGPKEWRNEVRRWKDVTSKSRRAVTLAMFTIAIIVVSVLLGAGIKSLPEQQSTTISALARLGFGAVDPMVVISWDIKGMIPNTLMANLAQPILSFLYFSYNSVFTAMLLGYEWSSYTNKKKGLRLSRSPEGSQRSTYFLQLPYRFAFPLMILSGILHWFVSQSIFLVAIDTYDEAGASYSKLKVCGYSPIAIIAVLILGSIMVIAMVGIGYVPYRVGMPLAGSCSLAMSAACHLRDWPGVDGFDAARQKVQWGVVGESEDGVGHCAFSDKDVKRPEVGKVYAGVTSGVRQRVVDGLDSLDGDES